ncbi:exopolyphosphatase [Halobacteroides halobius DSM 5150]|uniref:Exopolyphosphatase n=1 Tax=Halobacteroides halobius (strain ATCC 35273 / DSM 5150 / MD-1) TaxID=748449 RepID=L0K554_HALHC|nr:Ppx/GppA phosphatase family protein [Halobacteroides halobius]AGB40146.1 exopolyphosphatase [Halobacteroides halobius DSM 5150]
MKIGAIDLGTNSVRLLVAEPKEGQLNRLATELRVPRLGEDIHQTGFLKQEAIKRTTKVLQEYKQIIDRLDATPYVIATSAVRDARNKNEFITAVRRGLGLDVRSIAGEEEARLSYLGITSGLDNLSSKALAIDIGGGSTEFMWGKKQGIVEYKSLNLGAVRLTDSYGDNLKEIEKEVKAKLESRINDTYSQLVGVGGTITTLAAINYSLESYDREIIHESILSQEEIREILKKLSSLTLEKRKEVRGLSPDRADIIIPGIVILLEVMNKSNIAQIVVSETGILEGMIYDKVDKF